MVVFFFLIVWEIYVFGYVIFEDENWEYKDEGRIVCFLVVNFVLYDIVLMMFLKSRCNFKVIDVY